MSDYSLEEALAAADNTTEESFVIDSDLRTIQGPQKYVLGVFNDQNVQTVHFKCPRHYNGIDLSTFSIKINYMNASKKYDMSLVKNIKIADDYMTFDWLTSKNVFISPGTVTFNVCLTKVDDDSNITNEFNTTIYRIDVLEGLEVTMSEPEESAVKDFLAYINNTREHIDSISESVASDKNSVSEMKDAVTLLKDNAKAEADRSTESSTSAKVQAEKAKASADSVANVVSDVSKLKEDLGDFTLEIEGKNINSSDNEIGYIDDDGTLRNYQDCWRSKDFISVKQNGNICACQISYMNNVIRVCQYDKNKLFIKYSDLYMTRHHNGVVVTNIILSDDIAYIKITANGINETNTLDKSKTAIYYFDGINYPLEYIEYVSPKKVVDAKKVYNNGEAIKIPTKVSELENDENFISANGEITLKATVIFDFDAGATYDDRAKILEENGLVGTFHFNGNYMDENIVNNSIPLYMKGGHDVSLYGGVGTEPSLYIGEEAENMWYEYIKAGVEWFEKHGIYLGTMYACHVNKSSIGILKACKKLGFKYVRGSYCVVNGETWDTDKDCVYYNTGTNSPYKMPVYGYGMDKSFEEIKSAIDDAVAKDQTICLFTHTLAETTEGISMSKIIFRQVVEYVKSLKDAGSVDVLNAREYYDKYNQIDGEKRKYNRVMAGITNLSKVESN